MRTKIVCVAAVLASLAAAPAYAGSHVSISFYSAPAPVYYQPAPTVYYQPQPVVYYQPAPPPVYYAPAPAYYRSYRAYDRPRYVHRHGYRYAYGGGYYHGGD